MTNSSIAKSPLKADTLLGWITLIAMLSIAFFFEEERTTFADIAFHMFEHATRGEVAIQNNRFVSAITQFFPMLMFKAGVGMKWIQLVYSLAFSVFYFLTWITIRFGLKSREWALAWALLWLTFATHTYFWIQSELPQGLAILSIALAITTLSQDRQRGIWLSWLLSIPLLAVAAFAHPLLLIPATFAFGLIWLVNSNRNLATILDVFIKAIPFYLFYLIRVFFFSTPYDSSAGSGLSGGLHSLQNGDFPYSFWRFGSNLITEYYGFVLLSVAAFFLLWHTRNKLAALWTLAFIGGHATLVALSYPSEQTADFYIENLYLPIGFMAGAALAFGWKQVNNFNLSRPIGITLIMFALIRMGDVALKGKEVYNQRLTDLKGMMDRYQNKKVALIETPSLVDTLLITWGTGYEAWVISARNEKPTQGFVVVEDATSMTWALHDPNKFVANFHFPYFNELPARYFENPSSVPYVIIQQ